MARLTKAARAAGNIAVLPTAAGRKVDNYRFAEQRRASMQARQSSRFAGLHKPHYDRAADRLATDLAAIEQTPALLIISAILRTMESDAVTKVLEQLAPGAVGGSSAHCQAVATVKASRLNLGEQFDLMRAFDRLHKGEA
ncbi:MULTISPECIES: hypothetical protein [unclassified Sphingomonas]|uniref:hypothetical protein n=1 Tax=unclassified Sphingomonas TaxID=196159 RepID=UPI00226AE68A|nr:MULTISPECIES: hypothetical protein [unclassified Sphingomonas]